MSIVSPPIARQKAQNAIPAVIGHRGASATHPENTVEAFQAAFRAGAKAVELDVIPTSDGVLAITHDFVTAGGLSVRETPFAKLKGIPRLEELESIPSGIFDIEMKTRRTLGLQDADYAGMLVAAIRRIGIDKRVVVRSFDPELLREVHRIAPDLPLAALTGNPLHNWVRLAARTRAGAVSPHYRLVSRRRVTRAHRAGLFVMPWTANGPVIWQRLVAAGVDAIITDDPAALIKYLAERPEKPKRWRPNLLMPDPIPAKW